MTSSEGGPTGGLPARPTALDDEAVLRRVLGAALATGGSWAELFHERRVDAAVTLAGPTQRTRSGGLTAGVGLRVVGGGITCNVSSALSDERSLDELAVQAAEAFALMSAGAQPTAAGGLPKDTGVATRPPARRESADLDEAVRRGLDHQLLDERATAALLAASAVPHIDAVRVRLSGWLREVTVVSTGCTHRTFRDAGTRMTVDAFARRGDDRRKGRAGWCSGAVPAASGLPDAQATGAHAAEQAVRLVGTGPVRTDELPVILAARAAGLLVHELLGHSLEADAVDGGTSLVATMLGQQVTDSALSVLDGSAAPGVWGAPAVDDEGTPNVETELIRHGVFVDVLTDRSSGLVRDRRGSSGNGRRQSFEHPVLPRVSRTRVATGRTSRQDMVAGLRYGLLVHGLEGGAINARTGLLNLTVKEAQVVRDGEPAERVSGVALVGDARTTFGAVRAVGDDPEFCPLSCGKHGQWIPVSAESPSLLVERLRLVGG